MWIDTHAHLDAAEFEPDHAAVHLRARAAGVEMCVIPAVEAANFDTVRLLAQTQPMRWAFTRFTHRKRASLIWRNSMPRSTPTAMTPAWWPSVK